MKVEMKLFELVSKFTTMQAKTMPPRGTSGTGTGDNKYLRIEKSGAVLIELAPHKEGTKEREWAKALNFSLNIAEIVTFTEALTKWKGASFQHADDKRHIKKSFTLTPGVRTDKKTNEEIPIMKVYLSVTDESPEKKDNPPQSFQLSEKDASYITRVLDTTIPYLLGLPQITPVTSAKEVNEVE